MKKKQKRNCTFIAGTVEICRQPSVGICHSVYCCSMSLSLLLTSWITTNIQFNVHHLLMTHLSPSASPVIRLEMIRAQLHYTKAARGLLAGYDWLDWLDSLVAVMKYS